MFRFLGNFLWFLFGGLIAGLLWVVMGVVLCITLIGIPLGLQCFKMASLTFAPFGKEIVYSGGAGSFLMNILWILVCGWEMALYYLSAGLVCCVTIIGIPVGMQCFKMAKLTLMPFGAYIRS